MSLAQQLALNTGLGCLFALVYTYLGYPLLMSFLGKRKEISQRKPLSDSNCPTITIIIPARNAEDIIVHKLQNTLSMRYALDHDGNRLVQIIVVSDASDDATDEIVQRYEVKGVELIRQDPQAGKESAQNLALQQAQGEIILFTDVRAVLNPDTLENLAAHFADPTIGGISSVDVVEGGGEALYVNYEMWLRRQETRFCSLVGLSGSCFAVRREFCTLWHLDIPSDFFSALNVYAAGYRSILADDIPCTYGVIQASGNEYQRKVRTVLRGITAFFRYWRLMNVFTHGKFAFQFVSHKLMRWLAPIFLLIGVLTFAYVVKDTYLLPALIAGVYFVILLAGIAQLMPALQQNAFFKIPHFFMLSNLAIVSAWIRYLRGERMQTWKPTSA